MITDVTHYFEQEINNHIRDNEHLDNRLRIHLKHKKLYVVYYNRKLLFETLYVNTILNYIYINRKELII